VTASKAGYPALASHPRKSEGDGHAGPPAQSIADKLIAAAYELYGQPLEPGGEYIAAVTAEADVPAYFLNRLELARLPHTRELFHRLQGTLQDGNADMVMMAGLKHLAKDLALPSEERSIVEEIEEFSAWDPETGQEFNQELNELALLEAEKYRDEKDQNGRDD
jgi:hypothetical protein